MGLCVEQRYIRQSVTYRNTTCSRSFLLVFVVLLVCRGTRHQYIEGR